MVHISGSVSKRVLAYICFVFCLLVLILDWGEFGTHTHTTSRAYGDIYVNGVVWGANAHPGDLVGAPRVHPCTVV